MGQINLVNKLSVVNSLESSLAVSCFKNALVICAVQENNINPLVAMESFLD